MDLTFADLMDEVRHNWTHPFTNHVSMQSYHAQFMASLDEEKLR